jgi:hypothetical protein
VKRRWRVLTALVVVTLTAGALAGLARASSQPGRPAPKDPVRSLMIYYQAPVLVRAGETVAMPVQVVCVTARGHACEATVSLGVRGGDGDAWRFQTVRAGPRLSFDLSGPAKRAAFSSGDRSVAFFLQARARGVFSSLPASNAVPPLRFYVSSDIRTVTVPSVPFGHWKKGRTVLSLPWGSGPGRAGLALGRESPTFGPSSFHVDRAGRVHLLDPLQDYLGEFRGHRLIKRQPVATEPGADLAVTAKGVAFVAHMVQGAVGVTRLGPSGRNLGTVSLGRGVLSQVRTAGQSAYAEVLPLDAWVRVPPHPGSASKLAPIMGRPLPSGGRLLRIGTEHSVRLGIVHAGTVRGAVELRSSQRFGEVALAEPDGSGGYVVVVRTWQWRPRPADQFQVVHISNGRVAQSFAVSSRTFADTPPLSRFRLGEDGRLYQLVSTSAGIRIVRFEPKGES